MKLSKVIQIVSSISALTSKILLFFENIFGWPFSILGYILVAIYNFREKYTLLAVTVSGLVFTCSYSWYKWAYEIQGLQLFDYIVIGLTALFGLVVYILKVRKFVRMAMFTHFSLYLMLFIFEKESIFLCNSTNTFLNDCVSKSI